MPDVMKEQVILLVDNDRLRLEIIRSILSNKNLVGKKIEINALEDEELFAATNAIQAVWNRRQTDEDLKNYKENPENIQKAKSIALNLKKILGDYDEGWFDLRRLKKKTRWAKEMCENTIDNLLLFGFIIRNMDDVTKYKVILDENDKIDYLLELKQKTLKQLEEIDEELKRTV